MSWGSYSHQKFTSYCPRCLENKTFVSTTFHDSENCWDVDEGTHCGTCGLNQEDGISLFFWEFVIFSGLLAALMAVAKFLENEPLSILLIIPLAIVLLIRAIIILKWLIFFTIFALKWCFFRRHIRR